MRTLLVVGLIVVTASSAFGQTKGDRFGFGPRIEVPRNSPLLGPMDRQGRAIPSDGRPPRIIVPPQVNPVVMVERIEIMPIGPRGNSNMRRNEHASPPLAATGSPCTGASVTGFCN